MFVGVYSACVSERSMAIAEAARLPRPAAIACHNLGLVLARLDRLDEALAMEQQAVAAFAAQQDTRFEAGSRIYLAEILRRAGKGTDYGNVRRGQNTR